MSQQETRWIQRVLQWFPAILFCYLIPALITHGALLDLSKVYLHSLSRNWIIPMTIVTVMSALSITQLKRVGTKPIALFVLGSLVIATLPVLLVMIASKFSQSAKSLFLEQEYWRGLVPIVGSWIGGSTSQLVLRELTACPEQLFLSVIVLDNLLVNIWTILMFQAIKASDSFNSVLRVQAAMPQLMPQSSVTTSRSITSTMVTSAAILTTTLLVNWFTEDFLIRIILLSVIGLLLGNLVPQWSHALVLKSGGVLILIIMAILGLRLDFAGFSLPLTFVTMCIVWIIAHYIIMVVIAKFLNLHMAWVPIASMANLGGISTAPAVTAAYNKDWMPHAILLAILSMVTGNFWGIYSFYLFNRFVH
jgi:uncharacterized membrane protein